MCSTCCTSDLRSSLRLTTANRLLFIVFSRFCNWLVDEGKADAWNPAKYTIVPPAHMGRAVQHGDDVTNCGVFVCFYMFWFATGRVRYVRILGADLP